MAPSLLRCILVLTLVTSRSIQLQTRNDDVSLQEMHAQLSQLASQVTTLTAQLTVQQNKVATLESAVEKSRTSAAFFVRGGSSTVTALGGSPIVLTNVMANVGNAYDRQTGFFTAPVSGLYQFTANFVQNEVGGYVYAAIYVGTSIVAYTLSDTRGGGVRDSAATTALVHVTAGQTVHLGNSESRTVTYLGDLYLTFSGFLVRAD